MTIQSVLPDQANAALTERLPGAGALVVSPEPGAAHSTAADAAAIQAQDAQRVRSAVEQLDAFAKRSARNLEFRMDDTTRQIVVLVRDTETGEVIRQIPSAEALQIAARLAKEAAPRNVVVDTQA